MHRATCFIAAIVVLLVSGATGLAGQRDGDADAASEAEFATSWFLVRLGEPLSGRTASDTFPLITPSPGLNALVRKEGIQSIQSALPVSTRAPRSPRALSRHGLDRTYRFHVPAGSDIRRLVREFSALREVELAEPDFVVRPAAVLPDDSRFSDQWGLSQVPDADVDAPEAWEIATGDGVIVAVIDTGVDLGHEDMAGKWQPGWDFVDADATPQDLPGGSFSGHGTNASSIIAANTNNSLGIAGLCWGCQVVPLRVWDPNGNGGTASVIADAVVWAVDQGARVINFSGGGGSSTSQTELAGVAYAADAGVIHVSITMNDGISGIAYPGRLAETVAVGATDQNDWRADFSNHGPEIDLVAPGVDILSADLGDAYLYWSGTSYAGPFTAGVVATMLSVNPSLGMEEARQILQSAADDEVGDPSEDVPGFDVYHGWGRLNMQRALGAATSTTSLRLQGDSSTRVFLETPDPSASSYDFIRGDLDSLSEAATGVDLGTVVCLENDSPDPDTAGGNEDTDSPAPGEGFFYLSRTNTGAGTGGYGGSSRNRDRRATPMTWSADGDQQGARFGFSVAPAGDVDGDGYDDAVIGAYFFDNGEVNEGAAYVFRGSPTGLQGAPSWSRESDQAGAFFGVFVSSAGDVNGDGYGDVIVAASKFDNGETDEGRAHVYLGSPAGLAPAPHWTAEGDQDNARFGFRVGTAGDVNNDGYDDVVVAARLYDNGEPDEGRAYVYQGSAVGLRSTPAWVFETNQAGAEVTAVSSAGDVNSDGYDDVIVASRKYDGGQVDEGRIYVFQGSASGLASVPSAIREIDVANAELGFAVAPARDVNGDGFDDVLVSAHLYTNGESAEGAAFLYSGSPFGLSAGPAWSFESDQPKAHLGHSVSPAGDLNGDGFGDVVIGGGDYDDTRTDEGRVWLFLGSAAGLLSAPTWSGEDRQTSASYGWSAAGGGDLNGDGMDDLLVGAYLHDDDQTDEGRAVAYHGPLSALSGHDCAATAP